jgi:hypothetical protein
MLAAAQATKTRQRSPLLLSEYFLKPFCGDAIVAVSPDDSIPLHDWLANAEDCGLARLPPEKERAPGLDT